MKMGMNDEAEVYKNKEANIYKNIVDSYENISEFLLSVSKTLNRNKDNIGHPNYHKDIEKYLYFADRALEITREFNKIILSIKLKIIPDNNIEK